jgi:CRISPR-associated protein Cmr2
LLSGAKQAWKLLDVEHGNLLTLPNRMKRVDYLRDRENNLLPDSIRNSDDPRLVFWWLWRCLPKAVCQAFNDDSLLLMPAETRIPDGSIWSHASLTAALAGSLAGYDLTHAEIKHWIPKKEPSRPYIAVFSFTPVQEVIKASRKMRDFWAGSWILHYLSARICWAIAWKYGPDTVMYPSLYAQPLIDYWLLHGIGEKEGDFKGWKHLKDFTDYIETPSDRNILTAGFPNVLVFTLPKDKVEAAMQTAKQVLHDQWLHLGQLSFDEIRSNSASWMQGLQQESALWEGWLESQWQSYWSAYPVGDLGEDLRSSDIYKTDKRDPWTEKQNEFCLLHENDALFHDREREFLIKAGELRQQKWGRYPFKANVGSWWNHVFDRTRMALTAVKNARTWELPTAFGVRSTISGVGSALHANPKESEDSIKEQWQNRSGLFDGSEMLNASETLKRALHKTLPRLFPAILEHESDRIDSAYPDLTAGVAGYLKTHESQISHFRQTCQKILNDFPDAKGVVADMKGKWGIPYADDRLTLRPYHPRLLNAGWLIEDMTGVNDDNCDEVRKQLEVTIAKFYPNNNPADWYVLAAGDGDGMSKWLKGKPLETYEHYVPAALLEKARQSSNDNSLESEVNRAFLDFVTQKKRMGASTHNALSRALLDFSNQLAPYLTEQRYAGKLIYAGGDDVLAYTNLWEWDKWLWDIRQCFKGAKDPHNEFSNDGDYWQWQGKPQKNWSNRPLFTMGSNATISFGIVIANHSVPLAIALENLWKSEEEAKEHYCAESKPAKKKDAVQVRVIYGNGNILKATSKFAVFSQWQELLNFASEYPEIDLDAAIFEQSAQVWQQHPAPIQDAIEPWTIAFCDRRDVFKGNDATKVRFQEILSAFLDALWINTDSKDLDREVEKWLKLAAFTLRNRYIKLGDN